MFSVWRLVWQEELLRRINILENTIQEQKDQLGIASSSDTAVNSALVLPFSAHGPIEMPAA